MKSKKTSIVDSRLFADAMIDVVDTIRREVRESLGTSTFRVDIVTRRWSGSRRGEGSFKDSILTLDPNPTVILSTSDKLGPSGREASGSIRLSGISLRYSYSELMPDVGKSGEVAWKISDIRGQHQKDRWFIPDSDPVVRRDHTDWTITLHEVAALHGHGAVNS